MLYCAYDVEGVVGDECLDCGETVMYERKKEEVDDKEHGISKTVMSVR